MVYFYRLIILLLVAPIANAQQPVNYYSSGSGCGYSAIAPTTFSGYVSSFTGLFPYVCSNVSYSLVTASSSEPTITFTNRGTNLSSGVTTTSSPITFTPTITAYCAAAGVPATNGVCPAASACPSGKTYTGAVPATASPVIVCFGSCEADIIQATNQCAVNGVPSICGAWLGNGAQCSGSTSASTGAPSTNCPPGDVAGQFNGQTICLPSTPATPATQTKTDTQTTQNADGSTTKTTNNTTTSCSGVGSCTSTTTTTTTTTPPPGGGPPATTSKSTTDEKPQDSFCKENPGSPLCKSSSFGGSCGAFSCDGDSIQCAISRDQHNRNCTLFDTSTPLSNFGNSVASGTENLTGAIRSTQATRDVINLSGSLNESKVFASGCIPDRSYTLWRGTNFTIPFSSLCPYLRFMGAIVLAFAYLSAARIVGVV